MKVQLSSYTHLQGWETHKSIVRVNKSKKHSHGYDTVRWKLSVVETTTYLCAPCHLLIQDFNFTETIIKEIVIDYLLLTEIKFHPNHALFELLLRISIRKYDAANLVTANAHGKLTVLNILNTITNPYPFHNNTTYNFMVHLLFTSLYHVTFPRRLFNNHQTELDFVTCWLIRWTASYGTFRSISGVYWTSIDRFCCFSLLKKEWGLSKPSYLQ